MSTTITWANVQPRIVALQAQTIYPNNAQTWLSQWNELEHELREHGLWLYRNHAENTLDANHENAYLDFVTNLEPQLEVARQALKQQWLAANPETPNEALYQKRMRNEVALFRADNVALQAELVALASQYEKITGAQTVEQDGQEITLAQATALLANPDRTLRESVWKKADARRAQDRAQLSELYLEMHALRARVAQNAGLDNYRDYAWRSWQRFDYTPQDCLDFHDAIHHEIVPIANEILEQDRQAMQLPDMRPWDFDWRVPLDPNNQPPLQPFANSQELEEGTERLFRAFDAQLGEQFATMRQGFLDLDSRKGKAGGGFCEAFPVSQKPYIFMNAVGTHEDVQTMLHEAGHAFHAFAFLKHQPLVFDHWSPMEFAEVGSMAMELLGAAHFETEHGGFYSPKDAQRARREHLRGIVRFLPYMAIMDAFQHWVYTQKTISAEDLDVHWAELWERFSPGLNWSGHEAARGASWQRQGHLYSNPFYYVEYGIAQLGALQVWQNSKRDQARTLAQYKEALVLGNTKSLPALFAACGIKFAFDRQTVREVAQLLRQEISV